VTQETNSGVSIAPHEFEPLRFYDRWRMNGRCRACMCPNWVHPTSFWADARAIGDTSKARLPGDDVPSPEAKP